ncbi:acid protease [Suillus decipiens]|nr:acid protease [Suillus decipiens]
MRRTQRISLNSRSSAANSSKVFDPMTVWQQLDFVHSHFDVRSVAKRHGHVPLVNYNADLWYGEISVGTPLEAFTVVFDTGSSDLFLPFTQCDGYTQYDPAASSSPQDSGQPFMLMYGTGETAGEEYVHDVFVGGYGVVPGVHVLYPELVCKAKDQTVGAAWAYLPEFSKGRSFFADGFSGLAFPEISEFQGAPLF